ncbi:hypothetical protein [Tenacibaculum sp. 190524A05c]|uniref:hypothetical protein n=1 Tax=Tenacibaculum platacis TaxID=3137852 RepID=UPI0032B2C775
MQRILQFMIRHIIILSISTFLLVSCKKTVQNTTTKTQKTGMQIPVKRRGIDTLSSLSRKQVNDWMEYENLNSYLKQFNNTSPNDALNMAVELNEYIKILKDSLKIEDLKTNSLNARFNVLRNEALRLTDMTRIPAIQPDQVNAQIDKILLVFNSYTQKVNTIYSKKKFDEEIDLDNFFNTNQ